MHRVDVENILRQYPKNPNQTRNRYPNPFNDVDFRPDAFETDEFRMYSFKIKKCPLMRAHDWTICPYAHQGERARRRDPRKVPYVAASCPDYRASSGNCPRGELCEFAHGVFEYWLHPTKYRTRVCNAGKHCTRCVCFFAHSSQELRPETTAHVPKWVRVLCAKLQAAQTIEPLLPTTSASPQTGSTSGGREVGVIGRPATTSNTPTPSLWKLPSSSTGSVSGGVKERTQGLNLEFLDSLRTLRISDNHNNNNNQEVQGNNVNRVNVNSDVPSFDWVSELLAG